jgi:hypothetical protein
MRRMPRWLAVGFSSLLVGALLGGVVAIFLYSQRGPAHHIQSGEASYASGLKAVQQSRYDDAQVRFQEALFSSENALKELEEQNLESLPAEQFEKLQRLTGQAYWLKHRTLKAGGFTRLLQEQKSLPTFEGQAVGSPDEVLSKLSILRLPDEKMLREGLACLREAAYRMPGSVDILREAVAVEVQLDPPQWNHIHAFATTLGELDPKDERARFLLARLEYEQPITGKTASGVVSLPMPAAKRSRDRVLKGLEHLARLKELENPIRWRTLYLEAQMYGWLVQAYRQPAQRKVEAELDALQKLRALLLDQQPNVLSRAATEQRLEKLSKLDLQGIFGLHQMALELALEDNRRAAKAKQSEAERAGAERLQTVMDACVALANKTKAPGRSGDAADFLIQAALKVMPALAAARPEAWAGYRDHALELANEARKENACEPLLCLRVADLLTKESQWKQQRKSPAESTRQEASGWLDQGLKQIELRHQPAIAALPLHEAKLRLLLDCGGGREALQPHLEALRQGKNDSYLSVAALYEGIACEREGKLEWSQRLLEQALRSGRSDVTRRALGILAPLYLTLRQPERSLASLAELERGAARIEQLSPDEQQWYYSFLRQPGELTALKIQAHLSAADAALAQAATVQRDKNGAARHEQEAKKLLDSLTVKSAASARGRLSWAQHLLQHERLQEADEQLAILKRDSPDMLEVMQLEVDALVAKGEKAKAAGDPTPAGQLPPATLVQADTVIQNYMKLPHAHPAARLAWLTWLQHTGRAAEVQKWMADPAWFADAASNPQVQKIKTLAQIYFGNKAEAKSILSALPSDPMVDVALLQAALTATEQQEVLSQALSHHADAGLFRAWSAALALGRGDYVQACQSFLACLEYTRAKPLVRQGLTEALIALAQSNPQEARKLATEGLQTYPSESGLILGYAYASLLLGELGSPVDASEQIKDMATALRAYDAASLSEQRDAAQGPWVAAQFWLLAQRPDLARLEVARTLERSPKHESALLLGIKLALERGDITALNQARQLVALYSQLKPQSPEATFWQGKILQGEHKQNEALACYREVIAQHPTYSPAYAEYVDLLLAAQTLPAQQACQEALIRWRAALPHDLLAYQAEVRLLAQQGKLPETRQVLDQRVAVLEMKRASDNPIQAVELSSERQKQQLIMRVEMADFLCQGLMKAGQWEEAEKWLQRGLEACPEHLPTLLLLGEVRIARMQKEPAGSSARRQLAQQAADDYLKIYKGQKGQALAGNNLAWLQAAELDNPAEAFRIAQEVRLGKFATKPLSGDQLSADFLDTLGLIYQKLDRADLTAERVATFEAARRRYAQDPRVFLHLGHAYSSAKATRQAQQAYESARALLEQSTSLSQERKQSLRREIDSAQDRLRHLASSRPG